MDTTKLQGKKSAWRECAVEFFYTGRRKGGRVREPRRRRNEPRTTHGEEIREFVKQVSRVFYFSAKKFTRKNMWFDPSIRRGGITNELCRDRYFIACKMILHKTGEFLIR